jgi:hypothetical protein
MSEAEVAADLFKRDREAEQALESIALNSARHLSCRIPSIAVSNAANAACIAPRSEGLV